MGGKRVRDVISLDTEKDNVSTLGVSYDIRPARNTCNPTV